MLMNTIGYRTSSEAQLDDVLLPYTICFCRHQARVLLLYRTKPPNAQRWNGLGGKLEPGETPLTCVLREVREEADLDLRLAAHLRFAGIVTWRTGADRSGPRMGMYAYVADLPSTRSVWVGERIGPEGTLCWKPLPWICDNRNTTVVDNLSFFLPDMLTWVPLQ